MRFLAKVIAVGQTVPETFLDQLRLNELRSLSITIHQLFFASEMVSRFPLSNPVPLSVSDTDVIHTHRMFEPFMSSLREYLISPVKTELSVRVDEAKIKCLTLCKFLQSRLEYLDKKIKVDFQNGLPSDDDSEEVFYDALDRRFCLSVTLPSFQELSRRIDTVVVGVQDHFVSEEMETSVAEALSFFKNPDSFNFLSFGVNPTDKNDLKRMIYESSPQSFVGGLAVLGGLHTDQLDLIPLIAAISLAADRPLLGELSKFIEVYFDNVGHEISLTPDQLTQLKDISKRVILGQGSPADSKEFNDLILNIPDDHDAYFVFKGIELLAFHLHQVRQASRGEFVSFLKKSPQIKDDPRFDFPEQPSLSGAREIALSLQEIEGAFNDFRGHKEAYRTPFTRMSQLRESIQKKDLNAIFEFVCQAPSWMGESDLETQFYAHLTRLLREKVPAYLFCLETPVEAMRVVTDKLAYYFEKTEDVFRDSEVKVWRTARQFFSEGKVGECLESLGPFISRDELKSVEPMTTIYDSYCLLHSLKLMVEAEVPTWGSGVSAVKRWGGMSSEGLFFETWDESIAIRSRHLKEVTSQLDEIRHTLGDEKYFKALRLSKEIVAIKSMELQISSKNPHTLSYEDLAQLVSALKDDSFLHAKKGIRLDEISKIEDVLELLLYFDMVGGDHVIEALEGEKECRVQSVDRYRDQFFKDTEVQRSGSILNSIAYRLSQVCRAGVRGNFGLLYASAAGRMGAHIVSSDPQIRGNLDTAITLGAATLSVALFSPSWIPIIAGMVSANFTPSDYLSENLRSYQCHRTARVVDFAGAPMTSMVTSGVMGFLDYGSWEMAYNSAVRTPFYLGSMHMANTALERTLGYSDSQTVTYLGLMAGSLGAGYLASQYINDLPGMDHLQMTLPEWVILADQQRLAFEKNNCTELGFSYHEIWIVRQFFKASNQKQYRELAKVTHPDKVPYLESAKYTFTRVVECKKSTA